MLIPNKSVATNAENIEVNIKQLEQVEQDATKNDQKLADKLIKTLDGLKKQIDTSKKDADQINDAEIQNTDKFAEAVKGLSDKLKNIETQTRPLGQLPAFLRFLQKKYI